MAATEERIGLMEPMLPPEGERDIEDLAINLATKAAELAGQLPQPVKLGMGLLNLILEEDPGIILLLQNF